jgi:hypothetical protein
MSRSNVLMIAVVVFGFALSGCSSVHSMVDPGFPKVTYDDVKRRAEPLRLKLAAEFQHDGEHFPKADSTLLDHAERVLRASGVITPTADGPDGDIRIVMNTMGDKGMAIAKGIGTGLTLGLVPSTVTDSYEMDVMINAKGKTIQKQGIRLALHTTIGLQPDRVKHFDAAHNALLPEGAEEMPLLTAFGRVFDQMLLYALREMQNAGEL